MGAPDTIPDLQYQKPDGNPLTRLEMEHQLRDVWPKVYWLRIKANKIYGLPKQPSFDMKEAVLRHWVLDEMAKRGQIVGDQVGVNVQNYNDDGEQRQFIQRLTAMIQSGQAYAPKEGEGVDMSNIPQQPPIPVPQNGHGVPQFAPPAPPPMGAPQGFAPPQPPSFTPPGMAPPQPPQGFAPAPQFAPPGVAPQQPPGYAPPSSPPGYAPQQAAMPPAAPPQPQAAAPATTGRGRGRKAADAAPAAAPPAAPVPPMAPQFAQQPQGAFPPLPQQGYAFSTFPGQQQAAPVQQAPVQDSQVEAKIDQLAGLVQQQAQIIGGLQKQIQILTMGAALTLRAAYGKQGAPDMMSILAELGVQVPQ